MRPSRQEWIIRLIVRNGSKAKQIFFENLKTNFVRVKKKKKESVYLDKMKLLICTFEQTYLREFTIWVKVYLRSTLPSREHKTSHNSGFINILKYQTAKVTAPLENCDLLGMYYE